MELGLPAEALKWLSTRPLWIDGPGWRVLHAGCDPQEGAESTRREDLMNQALAKFRQKTAFGGRTTGGLPW